MTQIGGPSIDSGPVRRSDQEQGLPGQPVPVAAAHRCPVRIPRSWLLEPDLRFFVPRGLLMALLNATDVDGNNNCCDHRIVETVPAPRVVAMLRDCR